MTITTAKLDQILEKGNALRTAQAEVGRLELELGKLLGEAPASTAKRAKTTTTANRIARTAKPAKKPTEPREGSTLDRIVRLAKAPLNLDAGAIAKELKLDLGNVHSRLWEARNRGLLPKKAKAS